MGAGNGRGSLFLLLLALGAFVGVMAGLLGIGGGLIVVPALLYLLPLAGISPEMSMHMALATSLASIIVTSGSSAMNHLKLGNVDMFVVKWLMPGVVIGGFVGANIAEWIPTHYLPKVFWPLRRGIRRSDRRSRAENIIL